MVCLDLLMIQWQPSITLRACVRKHFAFRTAVLVVAGAGYLAYRRWLTVHVVVLNYRHLENPIAFLNGSQSQGVWSFG